MNVLRTIAPRLRRAPAWGLAAALALLLQGCTEAPTPTPTAEAFGVGAKAPDFTLPAATGESVSLADYVGRQPVLLYFHMAVG